MVNTNKVIKEDEFPIFKDKNRKIVYLDNAATTQKPLSVITELENFYSNFNSNVHRGLYLWSERATQAFEGARVKLAEFIGAKDPHTVIFTKSATEAINLVALSWGESNLKEGDEIILTILEHHSNFLPWRKLAERKGALLKIVPLNSNRVITEKEFENYISEKTKLAVFTHISNVTGAILPIEEITKVLHRSGVKVLVDASQSVAHRPINVDHIGCDWLVFSGHKMYGPTGIGVLYGRREVLEETDPCFWGGGMVESVTEEAVQCSDLPYKFEAGTPPIAEAIALAKAVEFIEKLGWSWILNLEKELNYCARSQLNDCPGVRVLGPQNFEDQAGIWAFTLDGIHPHDLVHLAGERGVCLRAGHHCAEPLHRYLAINSSCRISWAVYNQTSDIEALVVSIKQTKEMLKI